MQFIAPMKGKEAFSPSPVAGQGRTWGCRIAPLPSWERGWGEGDGTFPGRPLIGRPSGATDAHRFPQMLAQRR